MINKSIAFNFFVFALLLTSCFPSEDEYEGTYLPGNVLEYGTKEPVEGALVPLFGVVSGDGSLISYLIDTVRTDVDGLFEFRTLDDDPSFFEIGKVRKDGYYDDVTFENGQNLFFKGDNQFVNPQILLDPKGWIKIIIKDVDSLQNQFDFLNASFIPGIHGIYFDSEGLFEVRSNRFHQIRYKEDKDQPLLFDSIYVPARDTVTYQFIY